MNLIIHRKKFAIDGIFGELLDEKGSLVAVTLEHAYYQDGKFYPKMPQGTYECKRGLHRLHGMINDFETFEIAEIPEHTNILFHQGNWNKDSEGCVLLGKRIGPMLNGGEMICDSKKAFDAFMALQEGMDTFTLVVLDFR